MSVKCVNANCLSAPGIELELRAALPGTTRGGSAHSPKLTGSVTGHLYPIEVHACIRRLKHDLFDVPSDARDARVAEYWRRSIRFAATIGRPNSVKRVLPLRLSDTNVLKRYSPAIRSQNTGGEAIPSVLTDIPIRWTILPAVIWFPFCRLSSQRPVESKSK